MKNWFIGVLCACLSVPAIANNYFYLGIGDVSYSLDAGHYVDTSDPDPLTNTFYFPGMSSDLYESPSLVIGGGQMFHKHFGIEGFLRYSQASLNDSSEPLEIDFYSLGLSFIATTTEIGDTPLELFGRLSAMSTYAKAYLNSDSDSIDSSTSNTFAVGAGLQWNLNKDYWARAEYIYGFDTTRDLSEFDYDGFLISLGKRF